MSDPLKVFITYSHKNTTKKDKLITRLTLLKREGIISIWHDNEFDKAIEDYNKSIELKPDYAKAYLGRGTVYREKGEADLALQDFRKVIELDPQIFSTLQNDQ